VHKHGDSGLDADFPGDLHDALGQVVDGGGNGARQRSAADPAKRDDWFDSAGPLLAQTVGLRLSPGLISVAQQRIKQ
jgi:hypothetical protein